jgi:anti-sigma regulatory factor (Ser/Thr protein kinase)
VRLPEGPEGAGPTEHDPARATGGTLSDERHAAGVFERDAAEVRRARNLVRSSLSAWGLAHQIPALELAVSELVTNALVHGSGDIEVQLTASHDVIRLVVADRGSHERPHIDRRADEGGVGGWGLQVVEQLADAWGTVSDRGQTHVWMERNTGWRGGEDHRST